MSDSATSLHRVLTALALLREATPAEIATQAGLGYSTVPPKLRRLEADELAMQSPDSGSGKFVRKWTLTPKGILATAVTPDTGAAGTVQAPDELATDGDNDGSDAASDEDTPSDGKESATEPAPMPEPAGPEPAPSHQLADIDPQPESASAAAVMAATASPNRQGASAAVGTSEPYPQDAVTAPAEIGSAEPAEPIEDVTAVDSQAPEPASQPASTSQQDAVTSSGTGVSAAGENDEPDEARDGEPAAAPQAMKPRRRSGSLRAAVLKVLQSNPDQKFTVSQVCKAVDAANTDSDAAKASAGAVNNALLKLTNDGLIQQVGDKPALYQAV